MSEILTITPIGRRPTPIKKECISTLAPTTYPPTVLSWLPQVPTTVMLVVSKQQDVTSIFSTPGIELNQSPAMAVIPPVVDAMAPSPTMVPMMVYNVSAILRFVDTNGGRVQEGDIIEFTFDVKNTTSALISAASINIPIPTRASYIAGSILVDGASLSDGDARVSIDSSSIIILLGSDGNGQLDANQSTTITFRARVAQGIVLAKAAVFFDQTKIQVSNQIMFTVEAAPPQQYLFISGVIARAIDPSLQLYSFDVIVTSTFTRSISGVTIQVPVQGFTIGNSSPTVAFLAPSATQVFTLTLQGPANATMASVQARGVTALDNGMTINVQSPVVRFDIPS